jgi:Ca2+-binding RTX toxin-like protein
MPVRRRWTTLIAGLALAACTLVGAAVAVAANVDCRDRGLICFGTQEDDRIVGTNGPEDIRGLGGEDTIFGNGFYDRIAGMVGRDFVNAGTGPDDVFGNGEADVLVGGGGPQDGRDEFSGGGGSDTLKPASGDDWVSGGEGTDIVVAGAGDDVVNGDEGADSELRGSQGGDVLKGSHGNDFIDAVRDEGTPQRDWVIGGAGFDRCRVDGRDIVESCERTP